MVACASGSLIIDGEFRSMSDSSGATDQSLVVPLWSNEVVSDFFKRTEYGLIVGGFLR